MKQVVKHIESKPKESSLRKRIEHAAKIPFSKFKDKRPSWMIDFDAH